MGKSWPSKRQTPEPDLLSAFARALLIVWIITAAILMTAVMIPFFASADTVYNLVPACEARLRGEPCILCGMTTAYVHMASFDISGALEANRWSVALWLGSILNFAAAKAYILFRLVKSSAGRRS